MLHVDWWSWKCIRCGWAVKNEQDDCSRQDVAEALIRLHVHRHDFEPAVLPVREAQQEELAAIRAFWLKPMTLPKYQSCGHEQAWPAQSIPATFPHGHVCVKCGGEWWTLTTMTEFRDARADIETLLTALSPSQPTETPSPEGEKSTTTI